MMRRFLLTVLIILAPAIAPLSAQEPAPASASAPAQSPAAAPAVQGFAYNADGRRDPFISLLRGGFDTQRSPGGRAPGLAGLAVSEVVLKGTMASQGGFVAILHGADNRTYTVRTGDKLFDGVVRGISQNAMVLLQHVNDPLSLEKEREVRKQLRQTEEVK
jgi:Tfp pilus assembly protein PilP